MMMGDEHKKGVDLMIMVGGGDKKSDYGDDYGDEALDMSVKGLYKAFKSGDLPAAKEALMHFVRAVVAQAEMTEHTEGPPDKEDNPGSHNPVGMGY